MAIFYLSVKSASRSSGGSAGGHALYIGRQGKYQNRNDDLGFFQSWNMPHWSQGEPLKFWQAADKYERANGRLYTELEFALPRELSPEVRERLAREFADEQLGNRHPYTLAIHNPLGLDRKEQPHAHLMFSERRVDDGISRSPEQFFKRANGKNPERGGAKKDRDWNRIEKVSELRLSWEEAANAALAREGHQERIDRRSLKERGIDRPPEPKLGVSQTAMLRRGELSIAAIEVLALRQERILSELMQWQSSELSLSSGLKPQTEKPELEERVLGKTLLDEVNAHIKTLDGQLDELHQERIGLGLERDGGVGMWHYPSPPSKEQIRKEALIHIGGEELREAINALRMRDIEYDNILWRLQRYEQSKHELGLWRYLPHEALRLHNERCLLEREVSEFNERSRMSASRYEKILAKLSSNPDVDRYVRQVLYAHQQRELMRNRVEREYLCVRQEIEKAKELAARLQLLKDREVQIRPERERGLPQILDPRAFERQVARTREQGKRI